MTATIERSWRCGDEVATRALGALLAAELAPAGVLLLEGDLGAGKTVLAQGVASGLGVDPGEVQSPTFALIREHQGSDSRRLRLLHADLYRLEPWQAEGLGLDELLAGPGVKVVEWAERLVGGFPGARRLRIRRLADGAREVVELGENVATDPEPAKQSQQSQQSRQSQQSETAPPRAGRRIAT
jgi:tRNA threonylcarbamoyladenosine biosynthesis protein TsaE